MVKLTIERDDGSVTVVENVIDWSYWTTENIRDYLDYREEANDVKINITEEQFKELCDEVHRQIFKYYSTAINEEEFHDIIDEVLEDMEVEIIEGEEE